jgi:hypothetical protein
MEYERNHFRVLAQPIDGEPVSSFPVFVMGMDTVPPAVPEVLGAEIDSNGHVLIRWLANKESDLWGYKVLMANDSTNEFSLLTAELIQDTFYIDTVNLDLQTEEIFYKLQAADQRNNRSDFTDIITIQKPDIHPPTKPFIVGFKQKEDSLLIELVGSGSQDAISYEIFMKNVNAKEAGWERIAVLDSVQIKEGFWTRKLEYDENYAFTARAIDDVGLISELSPIKLHYMEAPLEPYEPIERVEMRYDTATKLMTITWEYKEGSRVDDLLVYRGQEKNRIGKYKYVNEESNEFVDKLDKDWDHIFYYIKPSQKNQRQPYISELLKMNLREGPFNIKINTNVKK